MNKKVCLFFALLWVGFSSFAYDGLMAGEDKVYTIYSKWFDIIYPYECSESAMILFEKADGIYEEMARFYDKPIRGRLPVVITRQTEVFNAYFEYTPFNRIVLYDAVPAEDFASLEDSLIDCFKHELNHAFTLTMADGAIEKLSNVMGDIYKGAGSSVVISSFMAEGSSVFYESQGSLEVGRLNDSYYLNSCRQCKISNNFPDWSDVLGARSSFPGANTCYAFGGPFTEYLVKSYGIEKYSTLWYNCANLESLYFPSAFKNVYGVTLDSAWDAFIEDIYVPEVSYSNPTEEVFVNNFFDDTKSGFYNSSSRFECLSSFNDGFVYLDKSFGGVFRVTSDGNIKKLLSNSSLCGVSASLDGKYVVLTSYDFNGNADTYKVYVYSVENNSCISIDEEGLRDGCLLYRDGKYWLCAVKLEGADSSIKIFEAVTNSKGKIVKFNEASSLFFGRNSSVFSMTDCENGSLAFIYKDGVKWSIRIYDDFVSSVNSLDDVKFCEFSLASEKAFKAFKIKHLSYCADSGKFIFSYAQKDSLPRYGELVLNKRSLVFNDQQNVNDEDSNDDNVSNIIEGEFRLMKKDISGGVQFPVYYNGSICYSADFVFNKDLLKMDSCDLEFEVIKSLPSYGVVKDGEKHKSLENKVLIDSFVASSLEFSNIYKYKGYFIPISSVTGYGFTLDGVFDKAQYFPLGISYFTGDPWGGSTLMLSCLCDLFMTKAGLSASLSGGTDSGSFNYSDSVNIIFDIDGFNQLSNSFDSSMTQKFLNYGGISVYGKNTFFYGKNYHSIEKLSYWQNKFQNIDILKFLDVLPFDFDFIYSDSKIGLEVSGIHKSGCGVHEYFGISSGIEYRLLYLNVLSAEKSSKASQLYPFVKMCLPKLIPLDYYNGFTFNLPVSLLVGLYPNGNTVLQSNIECVLFGWQIEKGLGYVPLYLNSVNVIASYKSFFMDLADNKNMRIQNIYEDFKNFNNLSYSDCLTFSVMLNSSLNMGFAARLAGIFQFYADFNVYFHNSEKVFEWKPGFNLKI